MAATSSVGYEYPACNAALTRPFIPRLLELTAVVTPPVASAVSSLSNGIQPLQSPADVS
jgi:hypothetical protein